MNLEDFFRSLYLCQWKSPLDNHESPPPANIRAAWKGRVLLLFTFITMTMCVFTFFIVASLWNDFDDINWFIFTKLDVFFHWYLALFIIYMLLMLYACLVFIAGLHSHKSSAFNGNVKLSWINFTAMLLFIGAGIGYLVALSDLYPENWALADLAYNSLGPFVHILGFVIWTGLVYYVFQLWYSPFVSNFVKTTISVMYFTAFILLCCVPFLLSCPCLTSPNPHEKPKIIGHRGAPLLAPENTIMSFEKAIECAAEVLESDVHISLDGVPFLLHDDNLLRTTDVAQKFPNLELQRAEYFTWAEIQQLNAGDWFLATNPRLSLQYLSEDDKVEARNQTIPSLEEYVTLAKTNNKSVIFDLSRPPQGHPYHDNWVNITVETILRTGINESQVIWLYSDYSAAIVSELAPNFILFAPSFRSNAVQLGITGYNIQYTGLRDVGSLYKLPVISYVI